MTGYSEQSPRVFLFTFYQLSKKPTKLIIIACISYLMTKPLVLFITKHFPPFTQPAVSRLWWKIMLSFKTELKKVAVALQSHAKGHSAHGNLGVFLLNQKLVEDSVSRVAHAMQQGEHCPPPPTLCTPKLSLLFFLDFITHWFTTNFMCCSSQSFHVDVDRKH